MSNEAIELSLDELDNVAGGLSLILGDIGGFASSANNSFYQKTLNVAQQTYAGPNGSYTGSLFNFSEVASSAGQNIVIS
ncbi:hypothetical protein DSM106972_041140 [Dulcicalothrix desertica PCC 7102]|uniref:Bacteriocin n=1 Tax=Dulcicalothrix desertica PCC 7102 TaxID=232991 RepID=A0A3S1D8A4_9CYAN|nr:CTB family bacteriocin [Dulcicalothrix desertica]OKH54519.1 hypothetical protein NIES2101_06815 [Calothrix sp. HK-06]RUT05293.1 hypothetical protein DSM106972_041140 [Dulcicalothrix desertica PCC 7102]TWH43207.1 hypothetical protein CAL7102_06912 [Dulcicalothrix desertica PCC 7102]